MAFRPTRRQFFNIFLGGSAAAWLASVLYPAIRYLFPPEGTEAEVSSVKVEGALEMAKNSGKIVKFGRKPALLVRKPDGNFAAFTAKCTHLDCIVQYSADKERIWCACHNGQFDLNGLNVAGPPPKPLAPFDVHVKGSDVYISHKT